MVFKEVLGIQHINEHNKVIHREAVRAVIFKDSKILMVNSNKGDYKLPGGGVKKEENYEEALKREVEEETGYRVHQVKDEIGVIVQRNEDKYEKDAIFQMTSNYYLCEVSEEKTFQRLDDYEAELEFKPVWINLENAIEQNKRAKEKEDKNDWIYRENIVLKQLKEYFGEK